MTIGERIVKLRKALGLTQEGFARQIGNTQQHVSSIEKGVREPSEQLLILLSALYNTSMMWLTTGEGEMFIQPEGIIKNIIARFGDRAFYEAIMAVADEHALAILAPRASRGTDPELDRMQDILVDIWTLGDEDLKTWARVQFSRAFPNDVIEDVQKKRAEKPNRASTG